MAEPAPELAVNDAGDAAPAPAAESCETPPEPVAVSRPEGISDATARNFDFSQPPDGVEAKPSRSRPGQFSYFNKTTGETWSTLKEAWQEFFELNPNLRIPCPPGFREIEKSQEKVDEDTRKR